MLQKLNFHIQILFKISPRWGYVLSVHPYFRRALPYAIDDKAFSLKPRILKSLNFKSLTHKSLNLKF